MVDFPEFSAAPEYLFHTHHQGEHVEGLGDVILRAAPQSLHLMPGIAHGGQANDGDSIFL